MLDADAPTLDGNRRIYSLGSFFLEKELAGSPSNRRIYSFCSFLLKKEMAGSPSKE